MSSDEEKVLETELPVRRASFISQDRWATESLTTFAVQVLIPFLICGFGNIGAGQLLDNVQHRPVFLEVSELIIVVPSLMGLKGNLEMTLASRLSTAANCGIIDNFKAVWSITRGNLALLQCQATVVGFLASLCAIAAASFDEKPKLDHVLVLVTSCLMTANISSVVLSSFMILVVLLCRSLHINPDNVATPIASSLGDVTTVALIAVTSSFVFTRMNEFRWISPALVLFFVVITPLTAYYAFKNKYTKRVVRFGWTPIIAAMIISSLAGVVLNKSMTRFKSIAAYQPVINGVGGNLVAIQASRISTFLHQQVSCGTLPTDDSRVCNSPCNAFCTFGPHAKVAQILFLMAMPSHLLYLFVILTIEGSLATVNFTVMYLILLVLLYFTRILVFWLWKRELDPDDSAIPILTATGDILGVGLLTLGFYVVFLLNDSSVK